MIRIRIFLGLLDPNPDPLDRSTDPCFHNRNKLMLETTSVADPYVFGPPGSGSNSQRYGSGSGSGTFYHQAKIVKILSKTFNSLFLLFIFEK
jgi:hypothetical protein